MSRVVVSFEEMAGGRVSISGSEYHYLINVLRKRTGDTVTLLDGRGGVFEAVIESAGGGTAVLRLSGELPAGGSPPVKVTLLQGVPKGDKMDFVVQKGTELGLSRIIPLMCCRTQVKLDAGKAAARRARWQKIALQAALQCRRPDVPEVTLPAKFEEALSLVAPGALAVMPWENEKEMSLRRLLDGGYPGGEILIFIGPEGGFAPQEVERAREAGVVTVSLGPRILRTETAGMAVLAMIFYEWGDLGG